jgi:hypothetical protein
VRAQIILNSDVAVAWPPPDAQLYLMMNDANTPVGRGTAAQQQMAFPTAGQFDLIVTAEVQMVVSDYLQLGLVTTATNASIASIDASPRISPVFTMSRASEFTP